MCCRGYPRTHSKNIQGGYRVWKEWNGQVLSTVVWSVSANTTSLVVALESYLKHDNRLTVSYLFLIFRSISCTRMKPDWDKLAENSHSSVFIADVNCSDEEELCTENGVSGYPTIKVYKDGKVEDYKGPRGYDELNAYVDGNLAAKCSIKDLANTCSEKAAAFHGKWQPKSQEDIAKEIKRLSGMQSKSMQKDLKVWLKERLLILQQLSSAAGDEL